MVVLLSPAPGRIESAIVAYFGGMPPTPRAWGYGYRLTCSCEYEPRTFGTNVLVDQTRAMASAGHDGWDYRLLTALALFSGLFHGLADVTLVEAERLAVRMGSAPVPIRHADWGGCRADGTIMAVVYGPELAERGGVAMPLPLRLVPKPGG